LAFAIGRSVKEIPSKLQNIAETVLELLFSMIDGVTNDREKTKKFFPIVATIFIAVIASNWVELVPGLGSIGIWEEHHGKQILIPFIRSSSADLNFTASIAIVSFIATQVFGVAALGIGHYAGKFFVAPWKKPYFIGTFVGLLEFISEFSKVISFTFRLFGNIFAGEVLLFAVFASRVLCRLCAGISILHADVGIPYWCYHAAWRGDGACALVPLKIKY
jgi:F-type H+-transporting ATPase subunit a